MLLDAMVTPGRLSRLRSGPWLAALLVAVALGGASWADPKPKNARTRARAPARTKSLLFVGNSYTYYAKMPRFFRRLLAAGGHALKVDDRTGPNLFFHDHLADPKTMALIDGGGFDYVVIQGQSLAPLETKKDFMASGQALARRIQASGAKALLFETWARAPGHPYYGDPDSGANPAGMQARLSAGYRKLAQRSGAELLPIGRTMTEAVERSLSGTPLFDHDGTHPSLAGAYLAAMVVYGELTGQCPPLLKRAPARLRPKAVRKLRTLAARNAGVVCPR